MIDWRRPSSNTRWAWSSSWKGVSWKCVSRIKWVVVFCDTFQIWNNYVMDWNKLTWMECPRCVVKPETHWLAICYAIAMLTESLPHCQLLYWPNWMNTVLYVGKYASIVQIMKIGRKLFVILTNVMVVHMNNIMYCFNQLYQRHSIPWHEDFDPHLLLPPDERICYSLITFAVNMYFMIKTTN